MRVTFTDARTYMQKKKDNGNLANNLRLEQLENKKSADLYCVFIKQQFWTAGVNTYDFLLA